MNTTFLRGTGALAWVAFHASFPCHKSIGKRRKVMTKKRNFRLGLAGLLLSCLILMPVSGHAKAKKATDLIVTAPKPHQQVCSPLTVKGKAKSAWFFEGVFPLRLLDEQCHEITSGQAKAQGSWTTGDFVPFEGTLTFTVAKPTKAILVLQNDNPSGLPENARKKEIPLMLLPAKK
jgi:hypothetical protein